MTRSSGLARGAALLSQFGYAQHRSSLFCPVFQYQHLFIISFLRRIFILYPYFTLMISLFS